jgi:hypothetical protein
LSISVVNSLGSIGNGVLSTGSVAVVGAAVVPLPAACVPPFDPLPPQAETAVPIAIAATAAMVVLRI